METLEKLKLNRRESVEATGELNAPKFDIELGVWYETVLHGQTKRILVENTRKDKVQYKDAEEDVHSSTMPMARFLKFYRKV